MEPCACEGGRACDELGECQCAADWYGPLCDHRFHALAPPPVTFELFFDAQGNGWFFTDRGLLRWDEGTTPWFLEDDILTWMTEGAPSLHALAVGPDGELWFAKDKSVALYDDHGTPNDPMDDSFRQSSDWFFSFSGIAKIAIDDVGRLWVIPRGASGVRVLENLADFETDPPPLQSLLMDRTIIDLVIEGSTVWALTSDAVLLTSVGDDLTDAKDEEWLDVSAGSLPKGATLRRLFLGPDGTKWVDTTAGILTLSDGGEPFEPSGHAWAPWTPTAAERTEGHGELLQVGPDGSLWLLLPSQEIRRLPPEAEMAQKEPETYDLPKVAPQQSEVWSSVSGLGVRNEDQLWVIENGTPWIFDHGRTPTDPSDDEWFAVMQPAQSYARALVPAPDGTAWITASTPERTPRDCSNLFFHVAAGSLTDGTDDAWSASPRPDGTESCLDWLHADGQGTLWVGTTSMLYGDSAIFAHSASDRPWITAPDWLVLPESEGNGPSLVSAGDEHVWLGGSRLDFGPSLSDRADDSVGQVSVDAPSALGVDGAGYYWLAFNTEIGETEGRIRRLDDGGTPLDRTDDVWVPFFVPAEASLEPLGPIVELQIDGIDRKWMRIDARSDDFLSSFDDGGTPNDSSDDQWRFYHPSDETYIGSVRAIQVDASGADLWVATTSTFGFLETKRGLGVE